MNDLLDGLIKPEVKVSTEGIEIDPAKKLNKFLQDMWEGLGDEDTIQLQIFVEFPLDTGVKVHAVTTDDDYHGHSIPVKQVKVLYDYVKAVSKGKKANRMFITIFKDKSVRGEMIWDQTLQDKVEQLVAD